VKHKPPIYGLLAEFHEPEALIEAAHRAREAGYRKMDGYSPFPIEELPEALGFRHTRLPLIVLAGGLIGCAGGFFMQYYASVISYPLIVGGKPFNSWPAFIPVTFELTVLVAAFAAVLGMLGLNGLPTPYHPLFNVERFAMASRDRFFLCIEAVDPQFDRVETRKFLESMTEFGVYEVDH
jgi:hypothetical protein